jgi:hypothetical protein
MALSSDPDDNGEGEGYLGKTKGYIQQPPAACRHTCTWPHRSALTGVFACAGGTFALFSFDTRGVHPSPAGHTLSRVTPTAGGRG